VRLPTRSTLALVPLVAALVVGCSSTVDGTPSAVPTGSGAQSSGTPTEPGGTALPDQKPVPFTDCGSVVSQPSSDPKIKFSCYMLTLPLDYDDPSVGVTHVQLLKIHKDGTSPKKGSLLINPGGPGGGGIDFALSIYIALAPEVLDNFDLIGWDPRGVGLSDPLVCEDGKDFGELLATSADVGTPAGFAQAKAVARKFADACKARYGSFLGYFNTVNTVHDMERIRQAVGDPKLNFLGFSYGTVLGSQYAHFYPDKVRVEVLDGAVGPLTDDITSWGDQIKGFEDAFDQFSTWCKTKPSCNSIGDARQAVYGVFAAAKKKPLGTGTSRPLTWGLASLGVLEALYSQYYWAALADALVDAKRGDGAGLLDLADQYAQRNKDGSYSNLLNANFVINCNDSDSQPTDAQIRSTAAEWTTKYPMFGAWNAISLFQCQDWPAKATPPPLPTATTSAPILVVGNTHDPATPYQGAVDLTKTLGNAELLTWDGQGHTSYLSTTCVDDYVNNYLISGELPPKNTVCPA